VIDWSRLANRSLISVLLGLALYGLIVSLPHGMYYDFGTFHFAGVTLNQGANPYAVWSEVSDLPNLNPPSLLPLFGLLARFDQGPAFLVWYCLNLVLLAAVVLLLRRAYPQTSGLRWAWFMTLGGLWQALALGQIYLVLLCLVALAWIALDHDQPILAGILIGLVAAVKPNLLVVLALLLCARHWRPALAAFLSCGAVSAIPAILYGPVVYSQWVHLVLSFPDVCDFCITSPGNAALGGLTARLGVPIALAPLALSLLAGLAFVAWRYRPHPRNLVALGLVGGLLAAPIAWYGYTILLAPYLLTRRWDRWLTLAAVLLVVPLQVFARLPLGVALGALGSLWTFALTLILVSVLRDSVRPLSPAPPAVGAAPARASV
jgi:hypothetical protein